MPKSDAAGGEAIREGTFRPTMHFAAVKTREQQAPRRLFRTLDRVFVHARRRSTRCGDTPPSSVSSRRGGWLTIVGCLLVQAATPPTSGQGLVPGTGGRAPATGVTLPAGAVQPAAIPTRRLSVDEAVTLALENNLGIRSERYGPRIQDMVVADARSVWLPNLSLDMLRDNAVTPSGTFLDGVDTQVVDKLFSNVFTVNQQVPWAGGSYTAAWEGTRRTTTSFFSSFNPALGSNLRLSYTQPLLRNFAIDAGRQQVTVATTNREIADLGLRQAIASTERSVRNAYWDLVYAIAFLDVQRQSLELAEESLRNNRRRVEVGTMAPIDIVEAEAEVARNQEAVILADAQLARAEDLLRTLVLDPAAPGLLGRAPPADGPAARRAAPDRRRRGDPHRDRAAHRHRPAPQADREQRHERPLLREPVACPTSTCSSTTRSPVSAAAGSSADPDSRGRSSASRTTRSETSSGISSGTTFRPGRSD